MDDKELRDALDGLFAYDTGSTDSGIRDEGLRQRCVAELQQRAAPGETAARLFLSRMIRDMWLSDEALEQGYGIEDALEFTDWLGERMDFEIR